MEQGLAAMYGNGSSNTTKHFYAGDMKSTKKGAKMACKSKKKPGKK